MIFYSQRRFRKWGFRAILAIILGSIIILAADFTYGLMTVPHKPAQININYYYNLIGSQKVIALTFDDGPSPTKTDAIIKALKKEHVPATFFFMGSHALRYPNLVKEANDNGFEIGNHTFSHAPSVHSSPWRLRLELNITDTIIEAVTHTPIRLYRPPFLLDIGGDPTTTTGSRPQLSWATKDGYVVVGADVDPKDWTAGSSTQVVDDLVAKLSNGGHIVLLHDGSSEQHTVDALPGIIRELRSRGYTFATVSQVLGLDATKDFHLTKNLRAGDVDTTTDTSIYKLQRFLVMEGYPINDDRGVFGANTEKALTAWQTEQRITRDTAGQVGTYTRLVIEQRLKATMYQPIKASHLGAAYIFSWVTHFFIIAAPIVAQIVLVTVSTVLILVAVRLLLTLILRGVSAIHGTATMPTWTNGITVIIPAYNEEDNIGATVNSVLNSGIEKLEVFVMNDGSKDKTEQIVKEIERQYPKKLWLYNLKNGGKASALNYGFKLAHNEVVVTLDGDTIFDRNTISMLARHFHDPNVAAVAGKVCATRSRNLLNMFQTAEYIISQNMDKHGYNVVNAIGVVPGPVGAWRKSVVLAAGGYSLETLVEDQDLTLALLAAGHRVIYEPKAYAYSETPFTVNDFIKQRFRWIFGTVQCLWKYKHYLFNFRRPALGWVALPNTLIFSILLSLLMPLMDILLIITLFTGLAKSMIIGYLIFAAVDFTYAALAFMQESQRRWLIVLLPLQRLFYRFVICTVVYRSVAKAIEGSEPQWNKVKKRGDAHADHLQMLSENVLEATATATTVHPKLS